MEKRVRREALRRGKSHSGEGGDGGGRECKGNDGLHENETSTGAVRVERSRRGYGALLREVGRSEADALSMDHLALRSGRAPRDFSCKRLWEQEPQEFSVLARPPFPSKTATGVGCDSPLGS